MTKKYHKVKPFLKKTYAPPCPQTVPRVSSPTFIRSTLPVHPAQCLQHSHHTVHLPHACNTRAPAGVEERDEGTCVAKDIDASWSGQHWEVASDMPYPSSVMIELTKNMYCNDLR